MPEPGDPFAELTAAYVDQLRRTGQAVNHYCNADQRELLRRAGRAAGRQMGRPVRTVAAAEQDGECGKVVVILMDWGEANPLESRLSEARARNALDRAFAALSGP